MVSSYTTNKNLEKPGNGDYVDTWNIPVNDDMNIIDAALGGVTSLNATSGSANLTASQYQKLTFNITGAMSANVTYTIPNGVGGSWIVRNATTDASGGPYTITIGSGGGGSNVSVIRGKSTMVWSDGTNIRNVDENIPSIGTVTSVNVSGGSTGLTTSGGPVTTNGTITIAGVLNVASGGTNLTAFGTGVSNALSSNATGDGVMVLANAATMTNTTINVVTASNATITNSTISSSSVAARVNAAASQSSPMSWNSDSFDEYQITALANDLTINADSGTPLVGRKIIFSITDNGVARTLTWTGGVSKSFRAAGVDLPTTTVANKVLYVGFIYNDAAARWDCVASSQEA